MLVSELAKVTFSVVRIKGDDVFSIRTEDKCLFVWPFQDTLPHTADFFQKGLHITRALAAWCNPVPALPKRIHHELTEAIVKNNLKLARVFVGKCTSHQQNR